MPTNNYLLFPLEGSGLNFLPQARLKTMPYRWTWWGWVSLLLSVKRKVDFCPLSLGMSRNVLCAKLYVPVIKCLLVVVYVTCPLNYLCLFLLTIIIDESHPTKMLWILEALAKWYDICDRCVDPLHFLFLLCKSGKPSQGIAFWKDMAWPRYVKSNLNSSVGLCYHFKKKYFYLNILEFYWNS